MKSETVETCGTLHEMCIRDRLKGVSLSVARGQCVVVTGCSGCGKTTLMNRLRAEGPVSYTHLDVYKRQPSAFTSGAAEMCLSTSSFMASATVALDVYKRQAVGSGGATPSAGGSAAAGAGCGGEPAAGGAMPVAPPSPKRCV